MCSRWFACDFRGGNDCREYNYLYLVIATRNFVVVQFSGARLAARACRVLRLIMDSIYISFDFPFVFHDCHATRKLLFAAIFDHSFSRFWGSSLFAASFFLDSIDPKTAVCLCLRRTARAGDDVGRRPVFVMRQMLGGVRDDSSLFLSASELAVRRQREVSLPTVDAKQRAKCRRCSEARRPVSRRHRRRTR